MTLLRPQSEVMKMAMAEASYTGSDLLGYLCTLLNPTIHSVKGKRRATAYKDLVQEIVANGNAQNQAFAATNSHSPVITPTSELPNTESRQINTESRQINTESRQSNTVDDINNNDHSQLRRFYAHFDQIQANSSYDTETNLLASIKQNDDEEISKTFLDNFLHNVMASLSNTRGRWKPPDRRGDFTFNPGIMNGVSRRKRRALEHKITQRQYKSDPKTYANKLLDGKPLLDDLESPESEDIKIAYADIFGIASHQDTHTINDRKPTVTNLFYPITHSEITDRIKSTKSNRRYYTRCCEGTTNHYIGRSI